jgi:transposase-like protein
MNKTQLRVRRSASEKAAIVSEFQASGASVNALCKRRGLSPGSLYSWQRRSQDEASGLLDVMLDRRVPAAVSPSPLLAVKLNHGTEIHIFDLGLAEGLISRVASAGGVL